ncbi:phosphotransferase family protein [Nonomuraea aurantiaca]|uniref:phosphotransferase family protein n=1 Tax=Nonomuraea aurantiaca TaxID=2878562 RepID=UPI001CD9370A|nr:phosphotransferase [Nonomuraea aurantiaca]MCA2228829.1 phosphotransferase [Nonomuraea aurantiaca]
MTDTTSTEAAARDVLGAASRRAGLDAAGAELIRLGENALFRLPGGIIARITRSGQTAAAAREVAVARWLDANDVSAVKPWPDVDQPAEVDGRAITWWGELSAHRHGTALQVATALRRLHDLPPPSFDVGRLDPFVRLADRIERAATLNDADRRWMRRHLNELEAHYAELPKGLPECVVHGDAWIGNVVSTDDGDVVLLDLERCSVGPPEWDLTSTAVKAFTLAGITVEDYDVFVRAYGHDVTAWAGFETLRDIREFRMTCMAAQVAAENPTRHDEVMLRLACLRGERGSRPWRWMPVP